MSKFLLYFLVALSTSVHAKDDTKVTPTGTGRYTCTGNSYQCAQIEANNRAQADREQRQYQYEQDRAQAIVDRERRREEDYMRRTYGR